MGPSEVPQHDESAPQPHPEVSCLAISPYRFLTDRRISSGFFVSMFFPPKFNKSTSIEILLQKKHPFLKRKKILQLFQNLGIHPAFNILAPAAGFDQTRPAQFFDVMGDR
jgi:hypothetical protein